MAFTHFHVHSQYSILDGAASVPGLIDKAVADGMPALALTDHGNMFGIKLFYDTCRKKGIKPILGVEAYVARVSLYNKKEQVDRSGEHLIILAKNMKGYLNLVKLCSVAWVDGHYYRPRIDKALLEKHHEGLIVSSACLAGEICRKIKDGDIEGAEAAALWYKNLLGEDYYLEVMRHPAEAKTLYLAGDTIWCDYVKAAIDTFAPDVIVVNAAEATIVGFGRIIMGLEDVQAVLDHAPRAVVIASHMDNVGHEKLWRRDLRGYIREHHLEARLLVPEDGEVCRF